MKIKTSEATELQLDWLVAEALGNLRAVRVFGGDISYQPFAEPHIRKYWRPSTDWSQGGPIVEREKIGITYHDERDEWEVPNWGAWPTQTDDRQEVMGETALIAAMRCYVASKLGDEVEIPDELTGE